MKRPYILLVIIAIVSISTAFYSAEEPTQLFKRSIPTNIIPLLDADAMYSEYGTKRADFLESNVTEKSSSNPYKSTRVVVINYEQLKEYMTYIERESRRAGVTIEDLGLYLSKYPDDGRMPSGKRISESAGAESIFINPMTTFPGSTNSVGYAIQESDKGNIEAIPVGHVIDAKKGTNSRGIHSYTIQNEIKSMAANEFGHRPPPSTNGNGF